MRESPRLTDDEMKKLSSIICTHCHQSAGHSNKYCKGSLSGGECKWKLERIEQLSYLILEVQAKSSWDVLIRLERLPSIFRNKYNKKFTTDHALGISWAIESLRKSLNARGINKPN